jgi:two-component system NtrC family sensor kinase
MAGIAPGEHLASESFVMLVQIVTHALDNVQFRQQAERERLQSEAERERLEHLLHAVNQQQRTIDELLAVERQLSAELEAKVQERTAALREAQTRLIQSEKLAVIGQVASSLAHELNNPLQAIQSGLGLVLHNIETGNLVRPRRDLPIIQQEVERMAALIRRMLDFYRPVTFNDAPLDLSAVCESAAVLMRKRFQELRVSLEMDLSNDLPLTCGDRNQIIQVLLNLMLNATEAVSGERGIIVLRTRYDTEYVYLSVIDRGHGISPDHLERIFEPLYTTKARGLGLGLAISREIVERHSGTITVESNLSIGTSFTVRLPIKECSNG